MQNKPLEILKQYFGYPAFRPLQEEIIQSILDGKDTLALLPTGGGKSVCYQVPALCLPGICLVVTPLIALMKDQVMQLRRRNISALAIHSGMAFFEVKKALENATSGHFKFLFVSPERLQTRLFREYLPGMPVTLLAVDEAHCISQWGYDFRPPYLKIADLRDELQNVPVLALTATATPEVRTDICTRLQMQNPMVFAASFARPNLSFSVFETPHKLNKVLEILNRVPGSALIYCRNRKLTREIATWLQQQGISASYYHAGLGSEERSRRQEAWLRSQTRVMACTNAFGMGIDKPDVRVVVHLGPPESLEDYYQEAGRAGRDGKKAFAVLLFNRAELAAPEKNAERKFPPIETIRGIYQALANYLQLPAGSGEGRYFDFDLGLFCEKYKQDSVTVVHTLQTLATEGFVTFSESVFLPSRVEFCCNKENLYRFEQEQPLLEPLIKALLRTYEGIFDNEVNISERTLGRLLGCTPEQVTGMLTMLAAYQVIRYLPKKDSPQVFFPYSRVPAAQLVIDQQAYDSRKARYLYRLRQMAAYAQTGQCRSGRMQEYFGEQNAPECGICDNCLNRKKQEPVTHEQLLQWLGQVRKHLAAGPMGSVQLAGLLHIKKQLAEQVIELGLREEILLMDDGALVSLNSGA